MNHGENGKHEVHCELRLEPAPDPVEQWQCGPEAGEGWRRMTNGLETETTGFAAGRRLAYLARDEDGPDQVTIRTGVVAQERADGAAVAEENAASSLDRVSDVDTAAEVETASNVTTASKVSTASNVGAEADEETVVMVDTASAADTETPEPGSSRLVAVTDVVETGPGRHRHSAGKRPRSLPWRVFHVGRHRRA
ncbi:hypothetical protein VSH64_16695 [Amycolatopsis rhabdoformis]|uniref:Uncharacterized protein n=1 Tax=Amycolatopsis rhabdoformis TaxID=1448059 RepID=A0ABZ1IH27_9PSEU|nr:hypothetical protein [Amycolatopsis rhabdoformis]WSE33725.1 hypothetical protein VSH64_16695 [Amycolatopsis rhabdoformis]